MYNKYFLNHSSKYSYLITLVAVLAGVITIYLPILENGFVWDDVYSFFENPTYRDPANLTKALTGALIYQENFFRPIPVLSFLIQIHVFEMTAAKMHFVSLVIHATNTLLVMLVSVELLKRFDASFSFWSVALVGLIYGVHPALIEPVSFISSRFDVLMTTFLLFALYTDQRVVNQWLRTITVGTLFFLAALCKEMAIGFAIALPLWHYFLTPGQINLRDYIAKAKLRGDIRVYIAIVISGSLYLLLRYQALGFLFDSARYGNNIVLTLPEHFALVGLSVYRYFTLLLFPIGNLNVAHPLSLPLSLADYRVILGFVYLICLPILAWIYKKYRIKILVAYTMVLASLFPILGFIVLPRNTGLYFAESFLSFPTVMFVLALALPLNRLVKAEMEISTSISTAIRIGLVTWVCLAAFTVSSMIPVWKNNVSLWSRAKTVGSENIQVSNNLAAALLVTKQYKRAVDEAAFAVGIDRNNDKAWNNLALGLNGLGKYDDAEIAAKQAIIINSSEVRNFLTLGKIYFLSKKYQESESVLLDIKKSQPDNMSANIYLAYVYKETHRYPLAKLHMKQAINTLPNGKERRLLLDWIQALPS